MELLIMVWSKCGTFYKSYHFTLSKSSLENRSQLQCASCYSLGRGCCEHLPICHIPVDFKMPRLPVLLIVALAVIYPVYGLSCRQCLLSDCVNPVCKFGFAKDACGCCNVCAKGPGEDCGGPWSISGKCAEGYNCDKSKSPHETFNAVGTCVGDPQAIKMKNSPRNPISSSRGGGGRSGLLGGGRAGTVKKAAKKHRHQAFGSGIPPQYAALLRRHQGNRERGKRSLSSGRHRVGSAKLGATKHTHTAYGGIPKKYLELLKLRGASKGKRIKRSPFPRVRRPGTAKLSAKKHSHTAYGGIPKKYLELLKLRGSSK